MGDIGDNNGVWPEVAVYRVAEPDRLRDATVPATRYRLRYADGPHDAEALLVDPRSNRLYVATKEVAGGGLYRAPARLRTGQVNLLRRVAKVPPVVTDGAYLPDGRAFVLRDYQAAHVYAAPGRRVGSLELPLQQQGESLTATADGRSVLAGSEGLASEVWRVPLPAATLDRLTPPTSPPPAGLGTARRRPGGPRRAGLGDRPGPGPGRRRRGPGAGRPDPAPPPTSPAGRRMRLHDGEVDIDAGLVGRLVADQFPDLAGLPVTAVSSTGTVNAIYRLGDDLYARLPRVGRWAEGLDRERRWLPWLAPRLPLRVPEPVAAGRPGRSYPFPWALYRWIDGQPYADALVGDEGQAARDLARFVGELRGIEAVAGAPRGGRDPLRQLDTDTRAAISSAGAVIDGDAATAAWERALQAPAWDGTPVWIHGDLLRPNLLVGGGRLHAVIDFGAVGLGDPATDVIAAWSVFGPAGRAVFRAALEVDDGTWERARGIALHQAALIIPYYAETNPGFAASARRTVEEVLADLGA